MKIPMAMHWQILIGLTLAVICGLLTGTEVQILGVSFYSIYDFVGTLFLNALKMMIVPLITSSMIIGVMSLGKHHQLSKLGIRTLLYYLLSSTFAILIGLVLVNAFTPGIIDGQPAGASLGLNHDLGQLESKLENKGAGDIVGVFVRMIPPNIVAAAAEGQMLGLIFFAILFGFFLTRIPEETSKTLKDFWQAVFEVMMKMTMWVMSFAPIGVFGLVAKTIASTGFAVIAPLFGFFSVAFVGLSIHLLVILPLILKFLGRVSPWRHFRAMSPSLLTAFSTASSSATLPVTMECVEKRAGVSNQTTSFVIPLGATVNMDGTALYECVAAMFIAQAYGLNLSFGTQFVVVLTALLTSIGVAGIPAASLVAVTIILAAIGLPLEGVGLILAVDRLLDMVRTAVNVFSDSCGAVVIARSIGETEILQEST